jgi:hypothetical protein
MTAPTSVDGAVTRSTENRHSLLLRKIAAVTPAPRRMKLATVFFVAGSVLLPLGLVLLVIGWVGVGSSVFVFNQLTYLASGCLFGLGFIVIGGFLYFSHWQVLAVEELRAQGRAAEQRHAELIDALKTMGNRMGTHAAATPANPDLVVTETGSLVHRADCSLVRNRSSVRQLTAGEAASYRQCSVCGPIDG